MRIKVDFSEFFSDERKLSVVNVNKEEAETVRDVLHKIIRMFKLPSTGTRPTCKRRSKGNVADDKLEYGLFEEGFYVPPEETSTVLQDIGILKLKSLSNVKEETKERKKKKQKKEIAEDEDDEERMEEMAKEVSDENVSRRRKSKRHQIEREEHTGGKKKCRRRDGGQSDSALKDEDEPDSSKISKKQSGKKSRRSEQTQDTEHVDNEEPKRTKRKGRHQAESDEEEAGFSPKKHKKDVHSGTMSVTSTEELEGIAIKEKRKSKRAKLVVEKSVGIQVEEDAISESDDFKRRRCTRQSLADNEEVPPIVKLENPEEERSQEKEISTSNVIHMESDEASNGSFSGSSRSTEADGAVSMVGGQCSAEGVAESSKSDALPLPNAKKRRKRKHKKGKKKSPQNVLDEIDLAAQGKVTKMNKDPALSNDYCARNCQPFDNRLNSVSTSNSRSHVVFQSEDEDVPSASCSGDGNDIEILGQSPGPTKKRVSNATQSFSKDLDAQSPADKPSVIDIEGEELGWNCPESSASCGYSVEDIQRSFSQRSRSNLDSLAHLRRMCTEKSLTIVNVTSTKKTFNTKLVQLHNSPEQTIRGPPCPLQRSSEVSQSIRKTFHNLLSLEKNRVPMFVRTTREIEMGSLDMETEEQEVVVSQSQYETEVSAQSFISSADVDSPDLLCTPSTSGYVEANGTSADTPGPSTRNFHTPRPFQAMGEFLAHFRNARRPKEAEELQVISNHDYDIQDVLSSPEEIKQDDENEEDAVCIKGDDDITSTIEDAEPPLVIVPDTEDASAKSNANDMGNDTPRSKGPLSASDSQLEILSMMEEMITEGLKEDLLDEVKDKGEVDVKEAIFLKYPIMKTLPKTGEYLAIKVLNLDSALRPIYSKYIKVQVLDVSGLMIKLRTVKKLESKEELLTTVKDNDGVEEVDLTFEEEVDLTEDDQDVLQLDWRDILEPRLLFP